MAILNSVLQFSGSIENLSFFKTKRGRIVVRRKGGPSRKRMMTSPNFKETRENQTEFASSGKAAKQFRSAFQLAKGKRKDIIVSDEDMTGRLVKAMYSILVSDTTHPHGRRKVISGKKELLKGFQFNADASLDLFLMNSSHVEIDRIAGEITIKIPAFNPAATLSSPAAATHFRLIVKAGALDFNSKESVTATMESDAIPLTPLQDALTFTAPLDARNKPVFVTLEIQFFQIVNTHQYRLYSSTHNAMAVIHVETNKPVDVNEIRHQENKQNEKQKYKELQNTSPVGDCFVRSANRNHPHDIANGGTESKALP